MVTQGRGIQDYSNPFPYRKCRFRYGSHEIVGELSLSDYDDPALDTLFVSAERQFVPDELMPAFYANGYDPGSLEEPTMQLSFSHIPRADILEVYR